MNKGVKGLFGFMYSLTGKLVIVALYVIGFGFFFYLPLVQEVLRPSRILNVCTFAETFAPETIARFEAATGIKVNLTYAEIDEQVYAKFSINHGQDYDVVNISDYMVYMLANQGLLGELDHSKLHMFKHLDENLVSRGYDRGNRFSVPHKWYVYGIVYEKSFFNISPDAMSWDFVFDSPYKLCKQHRVKAPYRLCMLDDARDAMFLASLHLLGKTDNVDVADLERVKKLLLEQKHWVEAYTVHSSQYFLFAGVTPLALMSSNYMRKIMENSDRFEFAIPKEGSLLVVENLVIPKQSKKIDLAHQFIDFMLTEKIAALNASTYGYCSANKNANIIVNAQYVANKHLFPDNETFKRLFIPLLPSALKKTVEDLWLAVGFA